MGRAGLMLDTPITTAKVMEKTISSCGSPKLAFGPSKLTYLALRSEFRLSKRVPSSNKRID
jgi:hypothetical protein